MIFKKRLGLIEIQVSFAYALQVQVGLPNLPS